MTHESIGTILFIIAALELISGIYIFVTRVKGHVVYAHSMVVLGVVLWVFGNGMYFTTHDASVAIEWVRVFYMGTIILTLGFLYLVYVFPVALQKLPRFFWLFCIASVVYFFWLFGATNRAVVGVTVVGSNKTMQYGSVHHVFLIWFFAVFAWAFWVLYQKMRTVSGVHRWQVKSILIGVGLSFIFGSLFNLVIPVLGGVQLFILGSGSSVFWLAFTTYIIFGKR